MRFTGKTAVITGASRGIGLAIAQRLVEDGARVVITARKQEGLDEAVASLGGPERAVGLAGKADDPGHQADTVGLAVDSFGSLDFLVNNTGINRHIPSSASARPRTSPTRSRSCSRTRPPGSPASSSCLTAA